MTMSVPAIVDGGSAGASCVGIGGQAARNKRIVTAAVKMLRGHPKLNLIGRSNSGTQDRRTNFDGKLGI
jgi:hypothetical protein